MDHVDPDNLVPVLLESPYAGDTTESVRGNEEYARRCMRDCFSRGEAPFASHLLYTQPGVLDDNSSHERLLGINGGLLWGQFAAKTVVYVDRGISPGMKKGIRRACVAGRPVEKRHLYDYGERGAL